MKTPITRVAAAAVLLVLVAGAASAKDVYISPVYGIDGPPNTGLTIQDPFMSLTFALSGLSPTPIGAGDRILCLPGVYGAPAEAFPITLPSDVSMIGAGGALATFIAPPAGFLGTAIIVAGAVNPTTVVSGFSLGGPPAGGAPTGFNGIFVTGGAPLFWPTYPFPGLAPGPGIASPTIADNLITGFGNTGISCSSYTGTVSARVRDNVSYANTYYLGPFFANSGVAVFGTGPYGGYASVYNNITAYNKSGLFAYGVPPFAYPLFASNMSNLNTLAGIYSYLGAYPAMAGNTTLANTYGVFAPLAPFQFMVDSVAYYNAAYDVPAGAFLMASDTGVPPGPVFGPSNIAAPPILFFPSAAISTLSPCIDQGMTLGFPTHFPSSTPWITSEDAFGFGRIQDYLGVYQAYYGGAPGPWPDMGASELNGTLPCQNGTVNLGLGGTLSGPADVLFVNGSAGDADRNMEVSQTSPLTVYLANPPAGAVLPNKYFVAGWFGQPTPATMVLWPKGVGTGCFPLGGEFFRANMAKAALGPSSPEATACVQPCAVLDIPPFHPMLPPGTIVTFQGITTDVGGPGSAGGGTIGVAATNAVIVTVGL